MGRGSFRLYKRLSEKRRLAQIKLEHSKVKIIAVLIKSLFLAAGFTTSATAQKAIDLSVKGG